MLPIDTLNKITDTAIAATGRLIGTHTPAMLLPDGIDIESIEHLEEGRSRYRGTYSTESIKDYCAFVVDHSDTYAQGFINPSHMSCETFFNLGTVDDPGHGDFRAALTLQKTAAYHAVLSIIDKPLSQRDLAEWMEDWAHDLKVTDADGADILIATAVQKIRTITIKANSERTSSESNFSANRSAMDSIEAAHADQQPANITMTAKAYEGLGTVSFLLRMSVITGEQPKLKLRWVKREAQQEEIAADFKDVLKKEIGGVANLSIGNFNPGK